VDSLIEVDHNLSRSYDAMICVYDVVGNVIETHECEGDFKKPYITVHFYSRPEGVFPMIVGIRRSQFFRHFAKSALSSVWTMAYV